LVSVGSARQLVVDDEDDEDDEEDELLLDELELELELLELLAPLLLDEPPPPRQAASTATPLDADSQANIRRRPSAISAIRSRSWVKP
jgi:hypothetical protein